MLRFLYLTNDIKVAKVAGSEGVDWIFVDMETLGKEERQGHLDSVKSHHTVDDVRKLRTVVKPGGLLVRVDPIHDGSAKQIDEVIKAGADWIMLPMWKSTEEVLTFLNLINGRCHTMLLLETKKAEECLPQVLRLHGIDRIHIGLNDLHLSYGKKFMFEVLADGTVERICKEIKKAKIPYGFGGIGRIGGGQLPADHILGEHIRLGSSAVILSRSFCDLRTASISDAKAIFSSGVHELQERMKIWAAADEAALEANRQQLCREVEQIVFGLERNH